MLKTKGIITAILLALFFGACRSDRDKVIIQGNLENNIYKTIYLSKITPYGAFLIDSTEIRKGKFLFKVKTDECAACPVFYQLSLSQVNSMNTIAIGGDCLQIAADARILAKSYTIEGSDDAKRMFQLDRMLTAFIDTAESMRAFYEPYLENDDMREYVESQYNDLLSQYNENLIRFIKQNSHSMVSIPAFYQPRSRTQFLDEQENLDLLKLIYHDLREKYPDSEEVKFLEQRIRMNE